MEEELEWAMSQLEKRDRALGDIAGQEEEITGQLEAITASSAQVGRGMQKLKGQLEQIASLSEEGSETAGDVHSALMGANNAVESFEANHAIFLGKVKEQGEKLKGLAEESRKLAGPVGAFNGTGEFLQGECRSMQEIVNQMREFSKEMSVLALNAAIEAGRLGEPGIRFVEAAEGVREFSESYENAAVEMEVRLERALAQLGEMEEHAKELGGKCQELQSSLGRLAMAGMQNMATYETGQLNLREALSGNSIRRADELIQSLGDAALIKEEMEEQMEELAREQEGQKGCIDELESLYKKMREVAREGLEE